MILSLLVNGRELAAALKTLRKFTKRSQDPQLVFTFDDNLLTIDAPGIKLKATGLVRSRGRHTFIGTRSGASPLYHRLTKRC